MDERERERKRRGSPKCFVTFGTARVKLGNSAWTVAAGLVLINKVD